MRFITLFLACVVSTLLLACVVSVGLYVVSAADAPKKAQEVTEIVVQRNFGLAPIIWEDPVVLRPAKEDLYAQQSFNQLVQWLQSKKFFDMKERYGGPEPNDCGFTQITAVRGEQRKVVINYCDGGGAELWEIEMVIRGVAADIAKRKEEKKQIEAVIEENKKRRGD